jgi:hypothetical protein
MEKQYSLGDVPVEVMQMMVYEMGILSARDVLALLLTCKWLGATLRGSEHDLTQHRALKGVVWCAKWGWERAALLALSRGFIEKIPDQDSCSHAVPFLGQTLHVTIVADQLIHHPRLFGNAVRHGMNKLLPILLQEDLSHQFLDRLAVVACDSNQVGSLKLLLAEPRCNLQSEDGAGWSRIRTGETCIYSAVEGGHDEVLSILLASDYVDLSRLRFNPIVTATRGRHYRTLRLLLDDGRVDPSWNENEALTSAIKNCDADAMIILLSDRRVNPGAHYNKALLDADALTFEEGLDILMNDPRVDSSLVSRTGPETTFCWMMLSFVALYLSLALALGRFSQ